MTFVLGDHLNKPDCDVLTCDEIEGTYFHLDGGLVSFVEHDDSNHVTVLVRDPRDGTIIDDDSGIDLGNGKFKFSAAGNAWLENGILHFEKPGSMSESGMKIHGCSCSFVFAVFNNFNKTRVRVCSSSIFSKTNVFGVRIRVRCSPTLRV